MLCLFFSLLTRTLYALPSCKGDVLRCCLETVNRGLHTLDQPFKEIKNKEMLNLLNHQ